MESGTERYNLNIQRNLLKFNFVILLDIYIVSTLACHDVWLESSFKIVRLYSLEKYEICALQA